MGDDAGPAIGAPVRDPSARDLAALQGAWEQVRLEEDGVLDPPDMHGAPGALTLIDADRR